MTPEEQQMLKDERDFKARECEAIARGEIIRQLQSEFDQECERIQQGNADALYWKDVMDNI